MCLILRQRIKRARSKTSVFFLPSFLLGRILLQFWPLSRCYFADQAGFFVLVCFFPVTVCLICRDFLHEVLISFFVSARCLWNRKVDFVEGERLISKRSASLHFKSFSVAITIDSTYSLLKMKETWQSTSMIMSLPELRQLRGFLLPYLAVFLFVYVNMVQLSGWVLV